VDDFVGFGHEVGAVDDSVWIVIGGAIGKGVFLQLAGEDGPTAEAREDVEVQIGGAVAGEAFEGGRLGFFNSGATPGNEVVEVIGGGGGAFIGPEFEGGVQFVGGAGGGRGFAGAAVFIRVAGGAPVLGKRAKGNAMTGSALREEISEGLGLFDGAVEDVFGATEGVFVQGRELERAFGAGDFGAEIPRFVFGVGQGQFAAAEGELDGGVFVEGARDAVVSEGESRDGGESRRLDGVHGLTGVEFVGAESMTASWPRVFVVSFKLYSAARWTRRKPASKV
jgi:hypothetical protein